MTARIQEKTVSAYFYYMWNAWSKEECDTVFGSQSRHFWEKWDYLYRTFHGSAAEHFYAELSPANRRLVVERACELYDGNRLRDNPKYVGKTVEKTPERLVLVVDNAPQTSSWPATFPSLIRREGSLFSTTPRRPCSGSIWSGAAYRMNSSTE